MVCNAPLRRINVIDIFLVWKWNICETLHSYGTQSASYSENISLFFNISYFVEVYKVAVGPFSLQQLACFGADFMKAVIFKASD